MNSFGLEHHAQLGLGVQIKLYPQLASYLSYYSAIEYYLILYLAQA